MRIFTTAFLPQNEQRREILMKIYLIRHGRQSSPLCNVNVPLGEEGKQQVELLKQRLMGASFDALYSSDLIRAVETAEQINTWGLERIERPNLKEIDFGYLTGRADALNHVEYAEYFEQKKWGKEDVRIPGGECGKDVFDRAFSVIEEIIASGKQNVVVVTHGGVIRALLAGIFMQSQAKRFLLADSLEHTSITELWYHENTKRFTLERLNDHAHLEGYPVLCRNAWKK